MDAQRLTLATPADRAMIWAVWHACAQDTRTCWDETYPTPAVLQNDLENKRLFAFWQDGQILGSVTLQPPDDLEKQGYPFAVSDRATMLTRLCVDPPLMGRGLGFSLLGLAQQQAVLGGASAIHLLCDVRNLRGLALFDRAGYAEVCHATLYGDRFSVREKVL